MQKSAPHPNEYIYLKPPTYEQIMQVIKAHGVNPSQFERFYGIYRYCIKQLNPNIKTNTLRLPAKHWHIIFESLKKIEAGEPLPTQNEPGINGLAPRLKRKVSTWKPKVKKVGLISELL